MNRCASSVSYMMEMYQLLERKEMTDVAVVCEDGVLNCHAATLAAASKWWTEVLDPDSEQQTVIIPETRTSELNLILQLLYTGSTEGESFSGLLGTLGSLFPELSFQVNSGSDLSTESFGISVRDPGLAFRTGELAISQSEELEAEIPELDVVTESNSVWELPAPMTRSGEHYDENRESNAEIKSSDEQPLLKRSKGQQYKCGWCIKSFGYPKDLKKHVLVHSNQNPFHCKMCSRSVRASR